LQEKYGNKTRDGIQLLSDWIEAKPGQGSWFKKKYNSAFSVLNPKTSWVWKRLEEGKPDDRSPKQRYFDNWLDSAMVDVRAEKAGQATDVPFFETFLIGGK
jgi:hypothetical protein